MSGGAPIAVPRWVLAALGGGMVLSWMGLAFLAGRASVAPSAASEPAVAAGPSPAAPPLPAAGVTANDAAPADRAASSSAASSATPTPGGPPPNAQAERPPLETARYLAQMDQAIALGATGSDPNALAQAIVDDALAGRTDGFDAIIASNRAVLAAVQDITAPASCGRCGDHQRQTVALLQDSVALLERLREATRAGDLMALAGAQGAASTLEARARDIEALEARIRQGT